MRCVVRKLKADGRVKSEWVGRLLDSAESNWLVVLHHPDQHQKYANGLRVRADQMFLHCLNTVDPIGVLLRFDAQGAFVHAKCDAALPAVQDGAIVAFVDLDLDLLVSADFATHLQDEDVFARHCVEMAYSAELIETAQQSITLAREMVWTRSFPFCNHTLSQFLS